MKAIALIVVQGGVAYAYAPEHVDVRIIDRDDIEAGDGEVLYELPPGIGFEELAKEAGLEPGEAFAWEGDEHAPD
jgi:hypothetical protein